MGSEQNLRNGLRRRGDGATGFASQYVIVDLDISADALIKRYAGTKREAWVSEVIRGAVQRQRTKRPPSEAFTRGLRRAKVIAPVVIVDLGRDGTLDGWDVDPITGRKKKAGKNHAIIIDGRQRCMSERANDRAREKDGEPPRLLDCDYMVPSAKTPREDVVLFRVGSAIREARTPSARAEDAADMKGQRYALEDIAPYAEARDVAEVEMLLALHACCDEVKDSVDAGATPLKACLVLSTLSVEEQARRVARKVAGNGAAAKNGAAPPRSKTLPAHVLARVEAELPIDDGAPAVRHEAEVIRGALALARGDYKAAMGVSVLRAALLRAGYDEQTGRLPTGPRKGAA